MLLIYWALGWVSMCGSAWSWAADEIQPKGANLYQTLTGEGAETDRSRWDAVYKTPKYVYGTEPSALLQEHLLKLPMGNALDIAMGEGRNGVFLASKGFRVEGVDISSEALKKAQRLAKSRQVTIRTIQADLDRYEIKPDAYDVILNIMFLQRSLIPQIKRGLKKGGVVVFENYLEDQIAVDSSLRRDYLLKKGELKEWFKDFEILLYRETNDGKKALASLIARKRR